MKPEDIEVSLKMSGPNVKALHQLLQQLLLEVPAEELAKSYFGEGTQEIILRFQNRHGLRETGTVDQETWDKLQAQAALQTEKLAFLFEPNVLFGKVKELLRDLTKDRATFLTAKLNQQLRSEILKRIGTVSAAMREAIEQLAAQINYEEYEDRDMASLIKDRILEQVKAKEDLADEARQIKTDLDGPAAQKLRELLHLGDPVKENPIFSDYVRRAKIFRYAKVANLNQDTIEKLLENDLALAHPTEDSFSELVENGVLTAQEKKELKLVFELGKLTGDNLPFVKILKAEDLKSPADLIGLNKKVWVDLIKKEDLPLPPGETAETYAENILLNLENSYPTHFLLDRLANAEQMPKLDVLDRLQPLLEVQGRLLDGVKPAPFNWRKIGLEGRDQLQKDLNEISAFANTYRHLALGELINRKDIGAERKKEFIAGSLQLLDTFRKNNPSLDLRFANLIKRENGDIHWDGIAEKARPIVKKQLMAYQRVLNLADSTGHRQMLLSKGYDSAMAIAAKPESEFVNDSGLPKGEARMMYARANEYALNTCLDCGTIRDVAKGGYGNMAINNIPPALINDLRDIDGFDDLFGAQDYCDCEQCKSILGPAAYFVDLMHFIEQHVSTPAFIETNQTDHPLYLKNRRGDLWKLQLTCENTHTEIPYLTIVNEVLESYLRNAVAGDIYALLANPLQKISFGLPFNFPLTELRLYMGHFDISLHDVYRVLKEPERKLWRERLKISAEEFRVITQPDPVGVKFRFGQAANFNELPVQDFIRLAGINRQQLDELLDLRFHADVANITIEKQAVPDELQNFPEILRNLTPDRLDIVHRVIRLWQKTSWSLPDFDLVLTALKDAGVGGPDLNEAKILGLARLVDLQEKLKLNVEELCALADQLPVSKKFPLPPDKLVQRRLYERLFDLKNLFGEHDAATHELNTAANYHHYSLNTVNPNDQAIDPKTPLLLAGLGISETELLLLAALLKNEMPFDVNGDTVIDRRRMSLLFRHARLAKALKLSVDDFIQALALNFAPGNEVVNTLPQIQQLHEFASWLKSSGFNVSQLRFVLKGEESASVTYKTDLQTAVMLIEAVQASPEPNKLDVLKTQLAGFLNLTGDQLANTLEWANTDINGAGIQAALAANINLHVPANPADFDDLIALMHELERVLLLFSNLQFKDVTVAYLTNNAAALGIANLKQLTLDSIKALTFYKKLINLQEEGEPVVQDLINDYQAAGAFSAENIEQLAKLSLVDTSLIQSLVNSLVLPAVAIKALEYLWQALELCQTLGVNGYSLKKLSGEAEYPLIPVAMPLARVMAARDVALGAFSSKYDDEKARKEKLEPYQDQINVIKRDALCGYIIARLPDLKFKHNSDIYAYFLLDVEMSGCGRTSRVVAASSSAQLYVHRILANLEQSANDGKIVLAEVRDHDQFKQEWQWRQNYRLWEANRKVFLYPENYVEPDLRDNKTPIFRELEDELLQQKITKQSAEAAYQKYVSQFAELARLRIAGSYYHSDTDTYYFFGRTQQDPPQYFYRKWIDQKEWTPWERIELGISSPHVSALIRSGKLFLFWVEVNVRETTRVIAGSSFFEKYVYDCAFNYSFLKETNKWAAANKIKAWFEFPGAIPPEMFFSPLKQGIIADLEAEKIGEETLLALQVPGTQNYKGIRRRVENAVKALNEARKDTYEEVVESIKAGEDMRRDGILRSKSFLKCYPNRENQKVLIQYYLQQPNPIAIPLFITSDFTGRLNLFQNALDDAQGQLPAQPSKSFVKIAQGIGSDRWLVLDETANWTDGSADLDLYLFVLFNGPDPLTSTFHYPTYKPSLTIVNSSLGESFVFACANQEFLIHPFRSTDPNVQSERTTTRLSTSLADELGEKLFDEGLVEFLSLETQKKVERPIGINFRRPALLLPPVDNLTQIDFDGAYGCYYKELFFHIPFLIAHHLNANQRLEEAKWWYERIFDPTSTEAPDPMLPTERNWRHIEFRGLNVEKLQDILANDEAIKQYKENPFSPHAIARLRLTSYPKAIVMRYIDNLLDWGDALFAQDSTESINEATMLYLLASDLLGKRPVKLGTCETAAAPALTYENLGAAIDPRAEFLITLENWTLVKTINTRRRHNSRAMARNAVPVPADAEVSDSGGVIFAHPAGGAAVMAAMIEGNGVSPYNDVVKNKAVYAKKTMEWETEAPIAKDPSIEFTKQTTLAFCVPPNYVLLKYWSRVEDRLYKIRHCMNISGVRRKLSLFQPPIEPGALVRARAAGLSLEEIVQGLAAAPPPYRFSYLIDKAKQFAQTVQAFGSALLSALEKKDVEELTLLRSLHERNILRLTKEIRKQQLEEAEAQYQAAVETKTNVTNRETYYKDLIGAGLTGWETTEQISKHSATLLRLSESVVHLQAAITFLIPQLGSPFAMKYGGQELGDSGVEFAQWASSLAGILDSVSGSAALEAGFQRREQDWKQQLLLAQQELKQVEQQRVAAEIRQTMAQKELDLHEKNIEQAAEMDEFYKNKFSSLGLYNYLSSTLNRLYREAYNVAADLANMAEQAFKFERDDPDVLFIQPNNWQFDRAGLLAGEKLLLQLQQMEKAYVERNTRDFELTQSFSLAFLDPSALTRLRQTGTCEFTIPETLFDLIYPGQYRRMIKSVRVSIPCVAGPYINIGAKLTLNQSWIRRVTTTNPADLVDLPYRGVSSIATSNAVNDGGMFEFNFRDERYLPFEGAGAVSKWTLDLPSKIRLIDYETISDCIVHISYTAKDDGAYKVAVENQIVNALINYAQDVNKGLYRLFSLRHEFPDAFNRLLNPAGGNQITSFDLTERQFPYFLFHGEIEDQDLALDLAAVKVYLKPKGKDRVDTAGLNFRLNNSAAGPWANSGKNLKEAPVALIGDPLRQWTINAGANGLNKDELEDVLLLLRYTLV